MVGGAGTIAQSGALTQITQSSQSLAIDWNSFNVAAGEVVQFIQPGAQAVALNRIVGGSASEIFGRIDANGTVFLINTAGVLFAETAQINVANLMVSGLDMSTEDFMNGNYALAANGLPGAVVNHGVIAAASGGSVALIGGQVVNTGLIKADYGRVTLAGAEAGFLDFDGDGLLRFEVTGELKQKLDGADAAVTNAGTIKSGEVIMEAAAARGVFDTLVNNEGIVVAAAIDTSGGQIRLVAAGGDAVNTGTLDASSVTGNGGSVTMTATGGDVVNAGLIDVSSKAGQAGAVTLAAVDGKVVNTGTIEATSEQAGAGVIELAATGGNVESSGDLIATSVEGAGGTVLMESNADTLVTAGLVDVGSVESTGGIIHILGNRVAVMGPTRLGSSGGLGGGTILIGGDFRGANPLVRNASQTYIGPDVVINADVLLSGTAGRVIVWSEDVTRFYGTVSARGPPTATGGFVEVSSHGFLDYQGLVDLRAGVVGTLLLDPTDIVICDDAFGGGCSGTDLTGTGTNPVTFGQTSNQANSTLRVADLVTQLGLSNVIVTTASSGGSAGNITVQDPISWSSGNSLTLTATNSITINALARDGVTANGITATGSGSLTLNAGSSAAIDINGAISLNGGTFTSSSGTLNTGAGGTIAVGGGSIAITADNISLGAALSGTGTLLLQPLNAATTIGLGGGAGTFSLSTAEIAFFADGFSSITVGRADGTGGMTINAVTFNDPVVLRSPSGGTLVVAGTLTGAGNASVNLNGTTRLDAGVTTADQGITFNGNVSVGEGLSVTVTTGATAGGNITVTGATDGTAGGATETLTLVGGSGTVGLNGAVGAAAPLSLVLQSNDATSTGTVAFGSTVNVVGLATFAQAYAVTFAANGTFTNAVTFANTAGVTLGNDSSDVYTFDGGLTSTASTTTIAGSVATSNDALSLGALVLGTNTAIQAGTSTVSVGGVTQGAFTLALTADEIELTGAADSITGTGAITLAPATASQAVDIGGAGGTGALDLTATELATIADGHASITIGHASGAGGLTIGAITFNDPVILRSPAGGTLAVNGQITGAGNASITLDGAGATTVLAADIVTADTDIVISDSVQVAEAGTVTLSTGTGGGGNISITGTVDGTAGGVDESLTLVSGSGTIGITGAVGGTDPLDLVLQSDVAGNTGAVTFNGAVTALSLTTFARGYSVALLDGATITDAVSFLNTAGVTLGNANADVSTFNGGLTSTASTTTVAGTVATSNDALTLDAVVLASDATLTSGSGAIATGSVTDGASSFTLTLQDNTAGSTGDVTLGGSVTIADLVTFGQAYAVALQGAANAFDNQVTFLNTGTTTLGNDSTDASTFNGGVTATAGAVNVAGTVATSDDALDLGAVTLTANATLKSGAGVITIASATGAFALTLQEDTAGSTGGVTFAGNVTIDDLVTFGRGYAVTLQGAANTFTSQVTFLNTGTTTLGDADTDQSTFDGGLTATAGAVSLAGTVITTNDALSLGAVTMTAGATLRTGSGAITAASVTDGGGSFTLALGNGSQTGSVTFTGNVTVSDLDTFASAYGVAFQGASNLIDTATTFLNTGTTAFGNDSADVTTFDAGVTATAGAVSLAGTLATTNDSIALGAATLTAATTINAGTATVTLAAVTGSTFALTVTADEIELTGAAGSITGTGALVLRPTTVGQAIEIAGAGGTGALDLTATEIGTLADGFSSITIGRTADGTGTVTIAAAQAFNDNVTLVGGAIASNGNLTSTGNAVTLTARTGAITDGNGATSNVTATSLTASAVTGIDLDVTLTTLTSATVSGAGAIDINDTAGGLTVTTASTANGAIALRATGGTLTVAAATAGTGGNISLIADEIQLTGAAGSIAGTGALTLAPETTSQTIELGGAGGTAALDLTGTELATLANGFSGITIGLLTTGTGAVTVAGAVTFNDNLYLVGGSITSNAGLTSSGNTVTFEARTGSISDGDGGTAVNLTASTISLLANTSIDNSFDVAGVTSLTINVNTSFSVRGDNATALTTLSVSVNPSTFTNDYTYTLANFATLAFGLTDGAAIGDCSVGATGCVIANGIAWTGAAAMNLTLIAESGDLVLNDDNGGTSPAVSMGTAGGNITLQAAADIVDGNTSNSDDPTPAAADRNLITTSASTITFIAGDRVGGPGPVDDVGNLSSANEDIDVSGTGSFVITAPGGSDVYTDTTVTGLSLSGDPVNEVVDHFLSSPTVSYDIDESCADGNSCIHIVTITTAGYDFSYTGLSGDIYIDVNAINMNGGDVTIQADVGSIFETTNSTATEITTTTLVTLTAANGIGTAASPLDIAGGTLDASVTTAGGIYVNDADSIILAGVDSASGAIAISAGTSILDDGSNATTVSGTSVTLTAGTAIGASGANNEVDTATSVLALTVGTDLFVANTGNLTSLAITSTQAGDANTYALSSTLGLTSFALTDAGTNYTLSLDDDGLAFAFNGDESISVGAITVSATGSVGLTSTAGSVTDTDAGVSDITAQALTVAAATGINLDTTIDALTASNTTSGGVDIVDASGLSVITVSAAGQTVTLDAGTGAITDGNAAGTTNVTAAALSATAQTGIVLDTAVGTLTTDTSAGNGDQTLRELDGLTDVSLNAGTGDISLTAGGAVAQPTGSIIADALELLGASASYTLGSSGNDIGTLAGNTGAVTYVDANGFSVGSFGSSTGLTSSGAVSLTAGGDDSTLTITDALVATGVTLVADEMDITDTVNAGAGAVSLAPESTADTGDLIDLGSNPAAADTLELSDAELDFITAGSLTVGNGSAGDLTVSAAIDLTDTPAIASLGLVTGGNVLNGAAGSLTVPTLAVTAAGIGTGTDPLQIAVGSLTTDTSGANGDQFIVEANGLTDLDLDAGSGNIALVLTLGGIVDTAADAEDVQATTAIITLLDATTQAVGVAGVGGQVETAVSDLQVDTAAGNGNQYLAETDDLDDLQLDAGTGSVFLTAGGAIEDSTGGDGTDIDITANTISLAAATGIGSLLTLELAADYITADSLAGDIDLYNFSAGDAANPDAVGIPIVEVASLSTTNGNITFFQDGGASLLVDVATTATTGDITLTRDDFGTTDGGMALIFLSAADNVVAALTGATGGMVLDDVRAGTSVSLTSVTDISENEDVAGGVPDAAADITAPAVTIVAPNGVGKSTEALEVDVDALSVDTSGNNGDQYLAELNGLTDAELNAGTGDIELALVLGGIADTAVDSFDFIADALTLTLLDVTAQDVGGPGNPIETGVNALTVDTSTGGGSQYLQDDSADGLLGLDLDAGTGSIEIATSLAGMFDLDGNVDLRAASITALVTGAFGTVGNPIQTDTDSLSVDSSFGNGNQFIRETDGLTALELDAGTGGVFLTLVEGGIADLDGTVDVTAGGWSVTLGDTDLSGDDVGSLANPIATDVDFLEVFTSTGGGDQFVEEANGLLLVTLDAGTGSVTLTVTSGSVVDSDGLVDIAAASASVTVVAGSFGDTSLAAGDAIQTAVADLSVDTSGGGGGQFIRELDGLSELNLNAGAGDVALLSVGGSILSADAAVDVTAAGALLDAAAGGVGDTDTAAGNAIETSVDSLTATAGSGAAFVRESNGLTDLSITATTSANVLLVAGDLLDNSADGVDAAAPIVSLATPAGQIGVSGGTVEVGAGVTNLSLAVQSGFFVQAIGGPVLTDLAVTIDSSQPASGASSYQLLGFSNVGDWGTGTRGLYDETGGVGAVTIYNLDFTTTVNFSFTNVSGDIYLTDESTSGTGSGTQAVNLPSGGDITITALNGNIFDWKPSVGAAPADDSPFTDYNLLTTAAYTVSLNAPGNTVGAAGAGDIDVNGTGNLAIDAETSNVSSSVPLTSLSLTVDPLNDVVDILITGATTVDIDELCSSGNACVNTVDNGGANFDFSLTSVTGDILLASFAIEAIGAGDVSLTATNGGIFGLAGSTYHILTDGLITLTAGSGNTQPGNSIGTAALPIGLYNNYFLAPAATPVSLVLNRTADGDINVASYNFYAGLNLNGFSSTGGGSTTIIASNNETAINADLVQSGDITVWTQTSNGFGTDNVSVAAGVTVQSTNGNVALQAEDDVSLGAGSTVQAAGGTILLAAGFADTDGGGALVLADGATVTSAATSADAITLRGVTVDLDTTGATDISATGVGGGIRFFSAEGVDAMELGGTCLFASYCISDAELALLSDYDVLTFGEAGVQQGYIFIQTLQPTVGTADIFVNVDGGTDWIYLDDEGTGPAIQSVSGDITLTTATGDIYVWNSANGVAELQTAGTITLDAGGRIGDIGTPVEFAAGQDDVNIANAAGGAHLAGLGDLGLGTIATGGGLLDVSVAAGFTLTAAGTIDAGGGAITLGADEIDLLGGVGSVGSAGAVLVLQPTTSALAIDIGAAGDTGGSLSLTDGDIAALADGFAVVRIGQAGGTHTITIVDATFTDPVLLRAPVLGGAIVDDANDSTTDLIAPALAVNVSTGGVGQGTGGSLDINVGTLDVTSAGAVSINEADDVAIGLISAAGQTVTLVAGSEITDGNAGAVNVSAGLLDVTAVDGISLDTTITTLTASNSTAGGIDIAETNGMVLNTVSAPGQAITLNGGTGAITDNNAGATNITGGALSLTAAMGIDVDTAVTSLAASNTGTGGINVTDADDLALNAVTASSQAVTLASTAGALTDGNGATTNITAATATLSAVTGIGSADALELNVAAVAASNTASGAIQLVQPAGNLTIGVSGTGVTNAGGDVVLTATAGSLFIDENISSGADRTTLTAGSQITADGVSLTTAGELVLSAVNGISPGCGGGCFFTDADAIQASNTTSNGIEITNTGDVVLADITSLGYSIQNSGGGLNFQNTGTIAVNADVNTAQRARLYAFGLTGDIFINADIFSSLVAAFGADLYADRDIIQAAGTVVSGNNGSVSIGAGNEIALAAVSTTGTVFLSADLVSDNNGASTNVTANTLFVAAASGISLDTAIATLSSASNSTSGGIDIADVDGFAVNSVSAVGQTVSLTAGGAGALTDGNADGTTNVTADTFNASAGGGINLDTNITTLGTVIAGGTVDIADASSLAVDTVSAAGQVVNLTAGGVGGAITDGNADGTTNVTAATLNATAVAGIDLDTAVTTVGTVVAGGTVDLADADGFAVNTVTAAGQTVNLTAGGTGAITDGNADGTTNVTASLLVATADTGITLDTAVAFLTASNASSGGIDIADTDGFAVNTVSAPGQTVTLNGGTGSIADNNGDLVSNVTAATLSAIAALGIDLDTTVDSLNGSTSGVGNVRFDETDGITVTSFTTADGAFTLTSSGATTLTNVVSATSNDANDITVTAATGDISIGSVNAGSGGGDVTLTATAGSLLNDTSAVTGDVVTLNAANGIGASGSRITTTATTLAAATTAAGAIWLNETSGVTLSSVTAANGLIDIVTGGNTTIGSVVSSTDADANDITIVATAGDILVDLVDADVANDGALGDVTITAQAGSVNDFHANPDVTLDIRGDVVTVSGATGAGNLAHLDIDGNTLNVSGGTGSVGVNDLNGGTVTLSLTSGGDIFYGTGGTIYVDQVIAGGTVTLNSFGGSIQDDADDLTTDIIGTTVTLNGYTGIGGDALNVLVPVFDPLEALEIESTGLDLSTGIDVSAVLPVNVAAAAIVVRDIGGTTLADLDTVNGDITVLSDATLAVADIYAGTTTLSDVVLDGATGIADAGAGDVIADVLTVDAGGPVTLSTNANSLDVATSAAGAIAITEADDVTLSSISANAGAVSVTAGGSIAVTSVSASGQAVTLDAVNAITDTNGATTNVTAATLNAIAGAGIDLDTAVDTFDNVSAGGTVDLADADGVAVNTISAAGQTVNLATAGAGAITDGNADGTTNVTAAILNVAAPGGVNLDTDIGTLGSVTAGGTVDIADVDSLIVDAISAAGQTVTLAAGGSITENGDGAADVTADTLNVAAGGSLTLDTAIATLGTVTAGGAVDVADTDGFTIGSVSAPGQTVTLNAGTGGLDDDAADALTDITAATVNLVAAAGIGASDDLETSAEAINALSSAGDIDLNNDLSDLVGDGIVDIDLETTAGNILFDQTGGASVFVNNAVTNTSGDITVTATNPNGGIGAFFIDSAGAVTVTTVGSGEIIVREVIAATTAALTAFDTINEDSIFPTAGASVDPDVDVTAATIVLVAGNGIGNVEALELDGATIGADTTSGNVVLNSLATGPVTAASLSTGTGSIIFTQTGGQTLVVTSATTGDGPITITNTGADLTASSVTAGGLNDVVLTTLTGGDLVIGTVSTAASAILDAAGAITDGNGGTTNVSASLLDAGATTGISLDTDVDFLTADNLTSGGIDIADVDGFAANTVTAAGQAVTLDGGAGPITDNNGGLNNVTADQLTVAATAIDLDTTIASLTFNSAGAVLIDELDNVALAGASSADSLVLTAGGTITDGTDGDLAVTNNAMLSGTAITLGNDAGNATDFGTLTFSGAQVSIAEDSDTVLAGLSTATDTLSLTSAGTITDGTDGDLAVTNNATLSGTAITLGNDAGNATDFGTLTFSGAQVSIAEDSDTVLAGLSTATDTLSLTSAGTITDGTDGDLAVTNNATLSGTAITLGNDAGNATDFGTLTFTSGGAVAIAEDSDTVLAGANSADSLVLISAGTITDGTDGDLAVTNNANLSATGITLGDNGATNGTTFGSLTFTSAGAVSIAEDDATQFFGASSADSLSLTSAGPVTQAALSSLTITNATTLTASGNAITLDQANNNFNSVSIPTATTVVLNDFDGLILGDVSVSNLTATAGGALTDAGDVQVVLAAQFSGTSIDLGGAGENTSFNTVQFNSAGAVSIQEDTSLTLAGASTAGSLTLVAAGIDDGAGTLNVAGATTLTASGANITLDNGHQFNSVAVTDAVNVAITDVDAILLGPINTTGTLTVVSGGDITGAGALVIAGISTFTANGAGPYSIVLDDAGNDFADAVAFGGTGLVNVTVVDSSDLELSGANLSGNLDVTANGITASGALVVAGTTTFAAGAGNDLSLLAANDFGTVEIVSANNVSLNDINSVDLGNLNVSGDLVVMAFNDVTSSGNALVAGLADITATNGSVSLGNANDFTGAVTIDAAGDILLADLNNLALALIDGVSVTLDAGGTITDAEADGGTPGTRGAGEDIVFTGVLTVTADAFGTSTDPIEVSGPADAAMAFTINGGGFYGDFADDVSFSTLTVTGASAATIVARMITVDGDFDTGATTDVVLVARGQIDGGGGTITADTLLLDALNLVAFGGSGDPSDAVIGAIDSPILLDMASGADYFVPLTTLNGFGFINASNFTGTDFNRIFNDSNKRIFVIANFTDLIASVQGSFITALLFTIDSSQFRADLNIFGVDGAGLLLPYDQCEDEESADCAKQ